ncbi:MAG: ECF-type sigma factor, partial [Acidobacteriota bacterium]
RVGGESAELTLAATDIVHEAFLRLSKHQSGWDNRRHFFGSAASAMRRILIDHARRKAAGKRIPASEMVSVELAAEPFETPDVDLLALDQALDRLAEVNTRQAQVVEMRYFGGLSEPEIAAALGVARVTVSRDWSVARLRLRQMLR